MSDSREEKRLEARREITDALLNLRTVMAKHGVPAPDVLAYGTYGKGGRAMAYLSHIFDVHDLALNTVLEGRERRAVFLGYEFRIAGEQE
jgi:hypothetical protein